MKTLKASTPVGDILSRLVDSSAPSYSTELMKKLDRVAKSRRYLVRVLTEEEVEQIDREHLTGRNGWFKHGGRQLVVEESKTDQKVRVFAL
jgi:hypothetical protein